MAQVKFTSNLKRFFADLVEPWRDVRAAQVMRRL